MAISDISRANYVIMINKSIDVMIRLFNNISKITCLEQFDLHVGLKVQAEKLHKFAIYLNNVPDILRGAQPKIYHTKIEQIEKVIKQCSSFLMLQNIVRQCTIS